MALFLGVDIAKAELVIRVDEQALFIVANATGTITGWLASLPKDACIDMEFNERYHLQLAHLALQTTLGLKIWHIWHSRKSA